MGTHCDESLQCNSTYDLLSRSLYNMSDSAFSASREPYRSRVASKSRFSDNGWQSNSHASNEWIAVNLGETRLVEAIETQGVGQVHTKNYTVSSSFAGTDALGSVIIFDENNKNTNIVENQMPQPLITRHVRLAVVQHSYKAVLRWAIKGCSIPDH